MAKGYIFKSVKYRHIHLIQAPDGDLLRLTLYGSRHKLMGYQNIPLCRIQICLFQHCAHCVRVCLDVFFRIDTPHLCRF